jgi:hypothetical protein
VSLRAGDDSSHRGLFQTLRGPSHEPEGTHAPVEGRELFLRRVRKDGRPVAQLRGLERGGVCLVEAEVFPEATPTVPVRPGPYTFPNAQLAGEFAGEALEALLYLGCEIEGDPPLSGESDPRREAI